MPSESRVIMFDKLKRRRKDAVTETRSPITVIGIHREYPGEYIANVRCDTGTNTWLETVRFHVVPTENGKWSVTITDVDFPNDRCHSIVIEPTIDMPTFITAYILSGRW